MLISSLFLHLISSAVSSGRDKSLLYSRLSIITVLYSLFIAYNNLYMSYLDKGIGLYNGLFHVTTVTVSFNIFLYVITVFILALTSFYIRKAWVEEYSSISGLLLFKQKYANLSVLNVKNEQFKVLEYSLLILFIISGAVFLISTSDLISIFLSIELQSYGLYLLATLYRNSEKATSGGLTYFLLGGLSSCFILLGIALLYINSGTTNLDSLYVITSLSENNNLLNSYNSNYINFSLLILSIGFLFKVAAAPFHFWSPDVYDAIPTVVTTFVAIIPKISIFIFLLELVSYTSNSIFIQDISWTYCFIVSSLFSLVIGTVLGLSQSRIKRLFAFSTISHVGFLLLALSINSIESIKAYYFYILQYTLSNLNIFLIVIAIGWSLFFYVNTKENEFNKLSDKDNSPLQLISQLKGFYTINPILSISFALTIFSFAGIPPLIGFFGKQMVLSAALENGYYFMSIVAILTSVIGAVYYLSLIKQIFFEKCDYKLNPVLSDSQFNISKGKNSVLIGIKNISLSSYLSISISILTLLVLLFMFVSQEWLIASDILSLILFEN